MNKSSTRTGRNMIAGTVSILLAEALILPTGFITAVFLARKLGPADYGLFALASRLIIWIEWTSVSAFTDTTVKFVSEASDWHPVGTMVTRLHFIVGCGVSALLWLLASPLAHLFDEPSMADYLMLFALEIPIFCMATANGNILMGMGRFRARARISACRLVARLVLIVFFVEMGLSVRGAIMGTIGASFVEWIISRFYVRPSLFARSTFPFRRVLGFAVPVFMAALSLRIFKLDLFALKVLGGTAAQAGFYGVAANLSIPLALVCQSMASPLLSTLSHMLSHGESARAKEIGLTVLRAVLWMAPFAAMASGAASEIVGFIFGQKFLPAGPILSWLIFGTLGLLAIGISKTILMALNKPGLALILAGPMVPLALIGHLILVPLMGGIGASLVTASVACLGGGASLFAVYRIWGIFPPLKTVLNSLFCSLFAFGLSILWPVSGLMVILKLMVILIIIVLVFLSLGELTSREISLIRSMIRRKPDQ